MRTWHLLLALFLLAPVGLAGPSEEEPTTRSLLKIVRTDRDPEEWAEAVRLLRERDPETQKQLGRELEKLERRYQKALAAAAREIDDLGGPDSGSAAFKAALAHWEEAMDAARDFIFDPQKFPPGTPQNWKSVGWEQAVRLGDQAVAAFRAVEKIGAKGLGKAIALSPEEAEELHLEFQAAAEALARVQAVTGSTSEPPQIRELSETVLAIARGDFETSQRWIKSQPRGEARWRACYVHWQAFLARGRPVVQSLDGGTRRSLEDLNHYRMSLGHSPLLMNEKLMRSAAGHSEEMSRLGYFSHDSPVEERRTEGMRAALEGYRSSVSENIFKSSSLPPSVVAWKQSAKHHRTMTLPENVEAGIGNQGPCTMVFGAGEHETPPSVEY